MRGRAQSTSVWRVYEAATGERVSSDKVREQMAEIADSVVIGQQWGDDTRIVLGVRPASGGAVDADLAERIRQAIRRSASPRHVPARIFAVADIPRTLSYIVDLGPQCSELGFLVDLIKDRVLPGVTSE